MASSKEYLNYVLEQLSELDNITYRPMMGEYIIYYNRMIIGGIYDDRFLIKPTESVKLYVTNPQYELPYEGAKEMIMIDNIDNKIYLRDLIENMYEQNKK